MAVVIKWKCQCVCVCLCTHMCSCVAGVRESKRESSMKQEDEARDIEWSSVIFMSMEIIKNYNQGSIGEILSLCYVHFEKV